MAKKLSKEQWEQRIRDAGAGRHEFVRWAVDGEFLSKHKVVVKCVIDRHEWEAKVNNLVENQRGCPQCAGQRKWTAKERIEQINSLENISFVSWSGNYKNLYSKANVRCAIDGYEWGASAHNLVNHGRGCPQCSGKRRWTSEDRIEQINSLSGVRFVSWCGDYKNCYSKVIVRCKKDGFEWISSVDNIVNGGRGCPKCSKSGYNPAKTGTLYALRSECGKHLKVGISNNAVGRHKNLERTTPFNFSCIESIDGDGDKIRELEKYFHGKYESAGFAGYDGATEWLVCTPQLLEELRTIGDK